MVPVVPRACWKTLSVGSIAMAAGQVIQFARFEVIPLSSADGIHLMVYTVLATLVGRLLLQEDIKMAKGLSVVLCIIGSSLIVMGLISTVESVKQESHISSVDNENISSPLYINIKNGTSGNNTGMLPLPVEYSKTQQEPIPVSKERNHRNINTTDTRTLLFGFALCASNGLLDCIAMYCSTLIKKHVDDVLIINFWYIMMSTTFSFVMMFAVEYKRLTLPSQWDDIMFLMAHALSTGFGYLLWSALIVFLSFVAISLIMNFEIPVKMLCQYVIFPQLQPIKGGIYDCVGAVVITVGLLIPSVGELLEYRQKKSDEMSEESIPLSNMYEE